MDSSLHHGRTFRDFQIAVAQRAGLADYVNPDDANDNRARPPTDPNHLHLVKDAVNKGFIELFTSNGREWQWQEGVLAITLKSDGSHPWSIGSSGAIYALPAYVASDPLTSFTFSDDDTELDVCRFVDHDILRRNRDSSDVSTGAPCMVSCRFVRNNAGIGGAQTTAARLLEFWPRPDRAYTVEASFRFRPAPMVLDTDQPACGPDFDDAIETFAHLVLARHDRGNDPAKYADAERDAAGALARAIAVDNRSRQSHLGQLANTMRSKPARPSRSTGHTFKYNGTPIP